jgi:threonine dehydrogenase-like Zn-dependent dehydrogenase
MPSQVVGAASALRLAFDALRPAGVLSSVGVHTCPTFPWSPVEAYDKNLTFKAGRCPARTYMQVRRRLRVHAVVPIPNCGLNLVWGLNTNVRLPSPARP